MNEPSRYAIIGATGFLGRRVCRIIKQRNPDSQILPFGRRVIEICPGVQSQAADLKTEYSTVEEKLSLFKPHFLIILAAKTIYSPPKEQYEEYRLINTIVPKKLLDFSQKFGITCCYTSTDMVFDGENAPYSPTSPTSPLTIYGETKRNTEQELLGKAVVVRLSVMYGLGGGFLQFIYDKLSSNTSIELFEDEFRCFMWATEGMEMLLDLLHKNVDKTKIWHLAGPQRASRFEFGLTVAKIAKFNQKLVIPVKTKDIVKDTKRPPDLTLNCDETYKVLNRQPLDLERGITEALKEGKI